MAESTDISPTLTPIVWRYRFYCKQHEGSCHLSEWHYVEREEDCPRKDGYERQPIYPLVRFTLSSNGVGGGIEGSNNHEMRKGAERLEAARINAEGWLRSAREEKDRDKAVLYSEQAINAWKNAAYAFAEKLAELEEK